MAICKSKNQVLFPSFTLKYTLSSLVTTLHVVVMSSWILRSADSIYMFCIARTLCRHEIRANWLDYRYGNGPWTYIVDGYVGRGIRVKTPICGELRVSSSQFRVLFLGDSMAPLLSWEHLCMDCGCHWMGYDLFVSPARVPWNLQGIKP